MHRLLTNLILDHPLFSMFQHVLLLESTSAQHSRSKAQLLVQSLLLSPDYQNWLLEFDSAVKKQRLVMQISIFTKIPYLLDEDLEHHFQKFRMTDFRIQEFLISVAWFLDAVLQEFNDLMDESLEHQPSKILDDRVLKNLSCCPFLAPFLSFRYSTEFVLKIC